MVVVRLFYSFRLRTTLTTGTCSGGKMPARARKVPVKAAEPVAVAEPLPVATAPSEAKATRRRKSGDPGDHPIRAGLIRAFALHPEYGNVGRLRVSPQLNELVRQVLLSHAENTVQTLVRLRRESRSKRVAFDASDVATVNNAVAQGGEQQGNGAACNTNNPSPPPPTCPSPCPPV
jgi:hypothetical protein